MFLPVFVLCATCIAYAASSAIPMWELLSKEEKLSYLYSMFAYQVEEFCEFSEMTNCNQDLLKYGLNKLKDMTEDKIDTMDPYQRGATSLIWNTIMRGHVKQTKIQTTTTTAKPNSYEDDLSIGNDDLGSQGLESAKIQTVYRLPPPKGFIYVPVKTSYVVKSDTPEYRQPFDNILSTPLNDLESYNYDTPLTGPMVVRVHPDGTPVDNGPYRIPQDEDLQQYKMSQMKLPAF
ncbi:hypothetical protein RN001_010318 [Aquatica leii]|uniref:Rhythmically expressed gene 5 protein n=1 Tax=Aquatica leii TaxID=1421715 RepID=A0AAN7P6D9_9COLE|nr:hypothetical protein RN001_010318 [Aquatica leii]